MYTISGEVKGKTEHAVAPTIAEATNAARALIERGAGSVVITRNALPMKLAKKISFGRGRTIINIQTVRDARYRYPEERT